MTPATSNTILNLNLGKTGRWLTDLAGMCLYLWSQHLTCPKKDQGWTFSTYNNKTIQWQEHLIDTTIRFTAFQNFTSPVINLLKFLCMHMPCAYIKHFKIYTAATLIEIDLMWHFEFSSFNSSVLGLKLLFVACSLNAVSNSVFILPKIMRENTAYTHVWAIVRCAAY